MSMLVLFVVVLCLSCTNAKYPSADFVHGKPNPTTTNTTNTPTTPTTTTTPCKTKDGTIVKCGPCEHCSFEGNGCVSICAECEECQADVCVFSKPGYCYGPYLSKCYRAGEFFHQHGMCCILARDNAKNYCTLQTAL